MMQWGEYLCDGICEPAKCSACELQHRGSIEASWLEPLPYLLPSQFPEPSQQACQVALEQVLSMRDLIAFNQRQQADMLPSWWTRLSC